MLYHVSHTTTYSYSDPVSLCHNLVHLTPRDTDRQICLQSELTIIPEPNSVWTGNDYFGNPITFFSLQEPHRQLTVTATHLTRLDEGFVPNLANTPPWEAVRDRLKMQRDEESLDAIPWTYASRYIPPDHDLATWASDCFPPGRPILEAAKALTKKIFTQFKYDPTATTVTTPIRAVLELRRGVCQDFAHIQIGCLRSLGLAARYISGYLRTIPPAGKPRMVGADASHAWVSVWCPGVGWVDLDPTNDVIPSRDHITLSWGRDYDDVSPIRGVILGGGQHRVVVGVDVIPLDREPNRADEREKAE